jgi:arginine decarboxylase
MTQAVVGWESEEPIPDHVFNDYLESRAGELYYEDLNLARLLINGPAHPALQGIFPSPVELVYLPKIREKVDRLRAVFAEAIAATSYPGQFHYAYASKANAAEEVVRTTLSAGVHHEMSSAVDVEIALRMIDRGLLPPDRMIICNGFKPAGSRYATQIIRLRQHHEWVIPVVEDLNELPPLIESSHSFGVGLRQKAYGHHQNEAEMDATNSRFGLSLADLWKAADYIAAAPNLKLVMYHAMVGGQLTDRDEFISRLRPAMEIYARLRQRYPSLRTFNFGGGVPAPMTLDFNFDYSAWARLLLTTMQETCARYRVPAPDIVGEIGRYTTSEHGAHLFRVVAVKENNSPYPWYIVDGSIMSSFPDVWALSEHFVVLPLNHLDKPFRRVMVGGITCDSDDIYPPRSSQSPLYLPVETEDLHIGFFSVGAYQEMLGGVKGSKHCVLPEAVELIVDRDESGQYAFNIIAGQTTADVIRNLGYV